MEDAGGYQVVLDKDVHASTGTSGPSDAVGRERMAMEPLFGSAYSVGNILTFSAVGSQEFVPTCSNFVSTGSSAVTSGTGLLRAASRKRQLATSVTKAVSRPIMSMDMCPVVIQTYIW